MHFLHHLQKVWILFKFGYRIKSKRLDFLRHNLATSMYGNGVSIQGVRDYLGHSSENMTKQYIDFMPERIVSAEDKYFSRNQSFKLKGAKDDER